MTGVVRRGDALRTMGALLVGFGIDAVVTASPAVAAPDSWMWSLNPLSADSWIRIARNGHVTAYSGKVDTGAGLRTAFMQVIADELDVPIERITVIMADTAITPDQGKSVASQGISVGSQPLRVAAAEARHVIIGLGAKHFGVTPSDVRTAGGTVTLVGGSHRGISYGDLIGDQSLAVNLTLDRMTSYGPLLKTNTPLRSFTERKRVGTSTPRVDVPSKVAGTYQYVHNVRVPGMLHGRVVRPPAFGATVIALDEASVASIPNVRVVRRNDFIGVVAPREEHAIKAATVLKVTWSAASTLPAEGTQYDALRKAPVLGNVDSLAVGNVDSALNGAKRRLQAEYRFPYQMHGMLGPSCAVADVRDDRATIWSGSQWPQGTRNDVAKMLGLASEQVQLIWHEASGSYGRLGVDDAAADAALLSKEVRRPVRVQWMRHDEHRWEPISPGIPMDFDAALGENGRIAAFSLIEHVASTAVAESGASVAWELIGTAPGGKRLAGYPEDSPYDIPAQRLRVIYVKAPFRTLYLRAPGLQQSAFGIESFMDELAEIAGKNPIEFRLMHMAHPRDREVLQAAAKASGWSGFPAPSRGGRNAVLTGTGIAHARWGATGSRVAAAAKVSIERATGIVRVSNLWLAHDCGLMINPDGVRNQLEGGLLQGISRSIHEEVHFDARTITNVDWQSYPVLTFAEVPEVNVIMIDRPGDAPSGAGESGTVPITAAIGNAIYDATGRRIREAPFTPARIKALLA